MHASRVPLSHPPRRPLPPGACDAHAHIFGPPQVFPPAGGGSYEPPLAPFEDYRAMLDVTGLVRGVLVQPAAYLSDHRAIVDAVQRSAGFLRGIGVTTSAISDTALADLVANGIIGLRFVEVADPVGGGRFRGSVGFDELEKLAPRMKALGMQAHVWADCERLVADAPMLAKLGIAFVADHMGRPATALGAEAPAFRKFLGLVEDGVFWVKLAACRTSNQFPDYPDTRPFHDALIRANADNLIWGSDWPHIRMGTATPDVGHLIDLFEDWTGADDALRQKIFVKNPERLFGF